MNNELTRILEIANAFLKIPSAIGYEKTFLEHLNKKIKSLGYITELKDTYLVVKNEGARNLFSTHIDRHSIIQNENGDIEFLGFYLKKKEKTPFKREDIEEDEKELVEKLNEDGYISSLTDKHIKIYKDNIKIRFIREGGPDFFEKAGLRYVNCEAVSYDDKSGNILNRFSIERFDSDHTDQIVKFYLNPLPTQKDRIFSMISQIKVFDKEFYGQLDNVISAAVLYYLLETTDFTDEIIFTTKEEVSKSYLCVIDYLKGIEYNPKIIVLDTSPYENLSDYEDGFVVLRKGDENGLFDEKLSAEIEKFVNSSNIPHVYKPSDLGRTELGRLVHETGAKINGTTLQLPTKNYHTTYETSTLKCLENYCKIIKDISQR